MALLLINNMGFQIDNHHILQEHKTINSITVEGEDPYTTQETENLSVMMMFADTDSFFIRQISLLKASLELSLRLSWKSSRMHLPLGITSYIGRDEFMEWGYCSSLSFSSQAQDNKKTIHMGFTQAKMPGIVLDIGQGVTIKNGRVIPELGSL